MLGIMEQACGRRNDFFEGRVLAALGQAYEGNVDAAKAHLKNACEGFAACELFKSGLAHDCCHAFLLLNAPEEVEAWTDWVRRLDARRQSSVKCWLVGQAAMLRGKANEADQYFGKAISKSKMLAKDKPLPAPPTLVGDAACFYLTCENEKLLKVDKARELLGKVPANDASWQVLRARAALAAQDGEWQKAVDVLDECAKHVPKTLDNEVTAQREAYTQKQRWLRSKDRE
jgi:tetratricopeptide (TPR) repeat protein